ncbi:MAG TPA: ArsA-related P-loop ATPase [Acidimicrobiales bacterium]|nr:ArsA-related P-loop ATPase [Acidimicrobiales bacterium]
MTAEVPRPADDTAPGGAEPAPTHPPASLAVLAARSAIVVCCGSGGVGKTTISAALALEAARRGRRACVVTIDPARRLANALGVAELTNVAGRIDGPWPGELWALMLDSKGTFDDLIHRYAATPQQAEGILANRLYKNLSTALGGTQEYMAMEKLYELAEEGHYDLVVVDTPPSRNALDFLEAPGRLTRFLGHRLFQLLLTPTRAYLRAVSVAMQTLMRTLSKVAGAEIVQDAITFFQAFEGMEEGFRVRADHMRDLLWRDTTSFVLVTAPRADTVEEAGWFADRLHQSGLTVDGLVVNRVYPAFPPTPGLPPAPVGSALATLEANLRGYQALNAREEAVYGDLVRRLAPSPVARVPLLDIDVHDLHGLAVVAGHVFADGSAASVVGPAGAG